jgi:DNA helicase MCM8
MTLQSNGQNHNNNHNDNNNHNNNHNSNNIRNGSTSINPRSIIIHTRLYNVYPTIPIEHVKTSNAYKCITLKGRIVKVQSKRLRLFTANVLCIKCGQEFEHLFHDGRYELPTQCRGGQPCRGQKFELLRDTAKYIDYQKLKLQEDDNDIGSGGSGGGGGGSNNNSTSTSSSSAAGRTPRYIDLEVTDDLVDTCHAGDCVKVVGIIHALNTAVAKGKANRKAVSETSTYTLYMVANSIINTTADLHGNSNSNTHIGKQSSRGGLMFTKDQLEKITKVAHADHMMGPLSARMAFPFDLLVRSLCPGIIGHDCVKAGLLLALLGGTPPSSSGLEDVKSGLTIRSNIHCLIVGDPGMGTLF